MGSDPSRHAGPHQEAGSSYQVVRRFSDNTELGQAGSHAAPNHAVGEPMTSRDLDELIDRIVAKLERRVVADLERRSRRNLPGVF